MDAEQLQEIYNTYVDIDTPEAKIIVELVNEIMRKNKILFDIEVFYSKDAMVFVERKNL